MVAGVICSQFWAPGDWYHKEQERVKTKRAQGRAAAMMQEVQDPGKSQHDGTRDASVAEQ